MHNKLRQISQNAATLLNVHRTLYNLQISQNAIAIKKCTGAAPGSASYCPSTVHCILYTVHCTLYTAPSPHSLCQGWQICQPHYSNADWQKSGRNLLYFEQTLFGWTHLVALNFSKSQE